MGLALVAKTGQKVEPRAEAGAYHYVQHLRAVLTILFVAQAWQSDDVDPDGAQDILGWCEAFWLDSQSIELTEDDLQPVLLSGEALTMHYEAVPSADFQPTAFHLDAKAAQAAVGLWKYVNHSDHNGTLAVGDAVDVLALLRYIDPPILLLKPIDVLVIKRLRDFFEKAVAAQAMIEFR